jgi:hypothetical protein
MKVALALYAQKTLIGQMEKRNGVAVFDNPRVIMYDTKNNKTMLLPLIGNPKTVVIEMAELVYGIDEGKEYETYMAEVMGIVLPQKGKILDASGK